MEGRFFFKKKKKKKKKILGICCICNQTDNHRRNVSQNMAVFSMKYTSLQISLLQKHFGLKGNFGIFHSGSYFHTFLCLSHQRVQQYLSKRLQHNHSAYLHWHCPFTSTKSARLFATDRVGLLSLVSHMIMEGIPKGGDRFIKE